MTEKVRYRHAHTHGRGGLPNDFLDVLDAAIDCGDVRYHATWMAEETAPPGIMLMRQVHGFTICVIEREEKEVSRGYALCSRKDQFCRRIGRSIALGRALGRLGEASDAA